MEKLSDYIPLMIIILSVLFSIVSGSKKKAKKITGRTVLPGDIGKMDEPIEVSRPVFVPEEKRKENINRIRLLLKEEEKAENSRQLNKKKEVQTISVQEVAPNEIEEYKEPLFPGFSDMDELKRAVIYSEILQKKEY